MSNASIRRVVVALDDSECSRAVLQTSARIAALFDAELIGLFVEDRNLFTLTELPFAAEMGLSGARRPLRRDQLEREYRCLGREVEARAARIVDPFAPRWRFESCRGVVVEELMGRGGSEADLLSLGRFGHPLCPEPGQLGSVARAVLSRVRAATLIQHRPLSPGEPINLFLEGGAEDRKILWMGIALARIYESSLHVGAEQSIALHEIASRLGDHAGGLTSERGVSAEQMAVQGGLLICRRHRFNPDRIHSNVLLI